MFNASYDFYVMAQSFVFLCHVNAKMMPDHKSLMLLSCSFLGFLLMLRYSELAEDDRTQSLNVKLYQAQWSVWCTQNSIMGVGQLQQGLSDGL